MDPKICLKLLEIDKAQVSPEYKNSLKAHLTQKQVNTKKDMELTDIQRKIISKLSKENVAYESFKTLKPAEVNLIIQHCQQDHLQGEYQEANLILDNLKKVIDFNSFSNKKAFPLPMEFHHARVINDIILNLEENSKLNFSLVKDFMEAMQADRQVEKTQDNLKNLVFDQIQLSNQISLQIIRDEMNESKLREMLDVFCSSDIVSIVEEINHSLLEFLIIMEVISLSQDDIHPEQKIITLGRLCKQKETELTSLILHLTTLTQNQVDTSKISSMKQALRSNFLLKSMDDVGGKNSHLIDKFYKGLCAIWYYTLFVKGQPIEQLKNHVKESIPYERDEVQQVNTDVQSQDNQDQSSMEDVLYKQVTKSVVW